MAILGSSLGAILGMMIVFPLGLIKSPVVSEGREPTALFPAKIIPLYIGLAILAAIITTAIAAVLPARRAAKLNPVDVMR